MAIMWLVDVSPEEPQFFFFFFAINKFLLGATDLATPVGLSDLDLKNNLISQSLVLTASPGQGRRNHHPGLSQRETMLLSM